MKSNYEQHLYVITHKEVENLYGPDRKIMLVGAFNKFVPAGYASDYDINKENISNKNNTFCELTGFYYMVKHDKCDVLGLEHYRRLFSTKNIFGYKFLNKKQINRIMENYDLIVTKKSNFNMTVREQYAYFHYEDDLNKVREIIEDKYPDYLNSFDNVMQQYTLFICNMFIGKREIISDYADWVFDILFELEKKLDISERSVHQQRVFGFLSERLFNVYLNYHSEIKIKPVSIKFLGKISIKEQIKQILYSIKNKILKRG